jgi:hypothetical protein
MWPSTVSKNERFAAGFLSGLLLFVAANLYSYARMSCMMADGFCGFGFPFELYETGGFITISRILWSGLVADSFIGVTLSVLLGLLCKRLLLHRSDFK